MSEVQPFIVNGMVVVLAFLTAALVWLMCELRQLRRQIKILREQRDTWIKIANGEIMLFREGDRNE